MPKGGGYIKEFLLGCLKGESARNLVVVFGGISDLDLRLDRDSQVTICWGGTVHCLVLLCFVDIENKASDESCTNKNPCENPKNPRKTHISYPSENQWLVQMHSLLK